MCLSTSSKRSRSANIATSFRRKSHVECERGTNSLYRVIDTRFNRQNSPLCLLAKSLTCTVLNLQETLSKLNPISLQEIEGAKLMNRLDQKFLIRRNWIPSLLEDCKDFYRVLEVEGLRKSAYQNRFIETPAYASLNAHTRGRKIRFKARIRQYASNSKPSWR